MKRLLILGAAVLASATVPASMSSAQTIECAAEANVSRGGHWYYRIIDGRKCWYQGQPMMPKSSLYWPKSSVSEAEATPTAGQAAKPTTDGRNVAAQPTTAEPVPASAPTASASAWPTPTPVVNDISFESRWSGLRFRN